MSCRISSREEDIVKSSIDMRFFSSVKWVGVVDHDVGAFIVGLSFCSGLGDLLKEG